MTLWASATNTFQASQGTVADTSTLVAQLDKRYPAIVSWPADAQLAMLYWAYHNQSDFANKPMYTALRQLVPDFEAAGQLATWPNISLSDKAMMTQLFQNAADVISDNLDQSRLYYPGFPPGSYQAPAGPANLLMTALIATGVGVAGWLAYDRFKPKPPETAPPVLVEAK